MSLHASVRCACLLGTLLLALPAPPPAAAVPAKAKDKDDDNEREIAACTRRLEAIHAALLAYEKAHQRWPDRLSDLVPRFLPDREALRDPADPGTGDLGSNQAHPDPKFRVSYSYERNAGESNGLGQPLGYFPGPDLPGTGWGSWRLVNGHMEYFFGDQSPLVRCYHHRPPEEGRERGRDCVLNLTPSGRVYRSDYDWRAHPDSVDFLLRTLERDLSQGGAHARRHWLLWRVDEFFGGLDVPALGRGPLRPRMAALARALDGRRGDLAGDERAACRLAARLYLGAGDASRAIERLDACRAYPGAEWHPTIEAEIRAEAFHAARRYDREIATYEGLLAARPGVRPYMSRLADAYEAAGQAARAREWRDKADPGALLVGRPAPGFALRGLDGSALGLDALRRGRKALLINFWFCGCEPCRLEFPLLERLSRAHGPQGLGVVAINRGDRPEAIARFVEERGATFPIAVGGAEPEDPVFRAYHVEAYPTSYLVDAEGRVAWRGVGYGPELREGLSGALRKLGFEPKPGAP